MSDSPVSAVAFWDRFVLAAIPDLGLWVTDAGNPYAPLRVSEVRLDGGATAVLPGPGGAWVGGEAAVWWVDLADPAQPRASFLLPTATTVNGLAHSGGWLWVAQGGAGLVGLPPGRLGVQPP